MSTRRWVSSFMTAVRVEQPRTVAKVGRRPGEHAMELAKRWPEGNAIGGQPELANFMFMVTTALFDHRKRAPHLSAKFEVTQHEYSVAEIADVDRRIHRPDEAMLG